MASNRQHDIADFGDLIDPNAAHNLRERAAFGTAAATQDAGAQPLADIDAVRRKLDFLEITADKLLSAKFTAGMQEDMRSTIVELRALYALPPDAPRPDIEALVRELAELPDPKRSLLSHNERELIDFCQRLGAALQRGVA